MFFFLLSASGAWKRGTDDTGRTYYGNVETGETRWTVPMESLYPEGAPPPPPEDEDEE